MILTIAAAAAALTSCTVTDGDTIRCAGEKIRITGIDAPETGPCRPRGRKCAPGDGRASAEALRHVMARGNLRIIRLGTDHYGRTLGVVYAGGVNVACAQLEAGQAIYKPRWDNGRRVARDCPGLVGGSS